MTTAYEGDSDRRPLTEEHPVHKDLGFRIGRVHRTLRESWEREIADLGVTPPQAALLRAVVEGEACGLRGLARRMGTDVMNVRRLAEHLETAGLVTSGADPSHRQRRVLRPTPRGIATGEELARRASVRSRHIAGLLGEDDLATLQDLLGRLQEALAEERMHDE